METAISYCTKDHAYFSSDEPRWKSRILKLAETHPDEVMVLRRPEDNDGCIYATVPVRWIRIQPPKQMSDEFKVAAAERMKQYQKQAGNEKEHS